VVDDKGDPVTGKTIGIELTRADGGAGGAAPPTVSAGVGRYTVTVPALDAGGWRMRIDVGGEGQADYRFTVTP